MKKLLKFLVFICILFGCIGVYAQNNPPIPNMPQNGVPTPQQPVLNPPASPPALPDQQRPSPQAPPAGVTPVQPAIMPARPNDSVIRRTPSDTLKPRLMPENKSRRTKADSMYRYPLMPPDSLIKR
jgi:hypothetical protein